MKNPLKRLQPVIQQVQKQEREAAAKLAQSQQQLTQQQNQLEALRHYQQGYHHDWQAQASQGQTAYSLVNYRRFLEQLQFAIDMQKSRTENCREQVSAAQEHWQQQHSREQALAKLQERYQNEAARLASKREQNLLDEWAQRPRTSPFGQS